MKKHTCTHCHQTLRPVHPVEVKRAVQLLVALSKDPKNKMGEHQSLSDLCTTGNGLMFGAIAALARTEAAYRLQPDIDKWSSKWTSQEYNLAAQILSDGWMPVGYILDKEEDCCNCPTQTDEFVPDPNGNCTRVDKAGSTKGRVVYTKIPRSERTHSEVYCPLNTEPF
jgi:hypothetical protein